MLVVLNEAKLLSTINDRGYVTFIEKYSDLAYTVFSLISSSSREIFIAPRYYEPSIGSKLLSKFAEGVKLHILDANACGITFDERLRMASAHDAQNRKLILKLLDTPDVITKVERLDYSFIVVDGRQCCFELIDPTNPENFHCALKLDNPELAQKLIAVFENLAKNVDFSNWPMTTTV